MRLIRGNCIDFNQGVGYSFIKFLKPGYKN